MICFVISEFGIPSAIGILGRVKRSSRKNGCFECLEALLLYIKSDMGDLSYDDFSRWKIPEVKEYLRDRGLKTTGRKVELVALAYGANQMGVDTKMSSI